MDMEKINDLLQAIQRQRDAALNKCAHLEAELIAANRTIEAAAAKIAELEKEKEPELPLGGGGITAANGHDHEVLQ